MDRQTLDLDQQAEKEVCALVGRASLMLVENNVDAITVANFLREIVDAGGTLLDLKQARAIAHSHLERALG
jgi:hypothetical protein